MIELNPHFIKRHFNRASQCYDKHAHLQIEVGRRLMDRLQTIKQDPKVILDLGTSTGAMTEHLHTLYPNATIIGIDIAEKMLAHAQQKSTNHHSHFFCADAHALPIQANSIDLIISNLTLQWCDSATVFQQIQTALKPDGFCLFSSLGPDSLQEIHQAWAAIDDQHHAHEFMDMHHLGDILVEQHWCDPVVDMEQITMHYQSMSTLLHDLKGVGAQNIHPNRVKTLMGKTRWQQFLESYQRQFIEDNHYRLTYEVIFGHAFKPGLSATVACDAQGVAHFPLDYLRVPHD